MNRKPELLIPASSPEVLRTAVLYGADAVYIGGEAFSLRAKAQNFTIPEMKECVSFAHERGVKVYVTANILAHNADLPEAERYFTELKEENVGMDALIISDPALFTLAKKILPDVELHVSTQANNVNYGTFLFWHALGAKRVVTGRELSLQEIREIREKIPEEMEIETFVHGAMCISYSGRCLLSNFMAGRDANQGACTHPCRWKYSVMEETRPGEYYPVLETERGTFLFNSKDLNMIEHIPELVEAGIDSFKIEGRMKTALYVATVARTYRMAIDDYLRDPEYYQSRLEHYRSEIGKCTYREFTTGFFFGKPGSDAQIYDSNTYVKNYIYLGTADFMQSDLPEGFFCLEQKNKFSVGEEIEIMGRGGEDRRVKVEEIRNEEGEPMESAPHPKQKLMVRLSEMPGDQEILRRPASDQE